MGLISKLLPSATDEFECNACGNEFSKMFGPDQRPTCPACDSFDLEEV